MKLNAAFLFGGRSVEHEVSVISCSQAMAAADTSKYNVIPVYITKDGMMYTSETMKNIEVFKDIPALLKKSARVIFVRETDGTHMVKYPKPLFGGDLGIIDVAVPVVHGTNEEDGNLQGYLETVGLPYTGCDVLSSAVGMDKVVMKKLLKEAGVPVLDCEYFYSKNWYEDKEAVMAKLEKLGLPVIVKPANLGSSVGIKVAKDKISLEEAIEEAAAYAEKILVEHAITNLREINCAVMGDSDGAVCSVCEQPLNGKEILSYKDKYQSSEGSKSGGSKGMASLARKVPADLDAETEKTIKQACLDTFEILGCNGISRIDCMIDDDNGNIYVNEINTIPGSLAFYLWEAAGIPFTKAIDEMINLALKRKRKRDSLTFSYDTNLLQMQSSGGAKGAKGAKM